MSTDGQVNASEQSNRAAQLIQLAARDIEQDCTDYQALQGLMHSLYEQLLLRDCEKIDQLNQQIMVLLEFISQRAQRRGKILNAFGIPAAASNPGIVKLLCSLPDSTSALARWAQLENLIKETKTLNERNGKLLAMHNDIINQILGGHASEQVYSPGYY